MEAIKVTTTITLPEGVILTEAMSDAIQKIVDAGGITPVEPNPALKKCKRGPKPSKVTIVSDKVWDVLWDGDDVRELSWRIANFANTDEVIGQGTIKPTVEMQAHLTLNLSKVAAAGSTYVVTLTGVSCDGVGSINVLVPAKSGSISISSIELTNKS